jgi:hypothetical protein
MFPWIRSSSALCVDRWLIVGRLRSDAISILLQRGGSKNGTHVEYFEDSIILPFIVRPGLRKRTTYVSNEKCKDAARIKAFAATDVTLARTYLPKHIATIVHDWTVPSRS